MMKLQTFIATSVLLTLCSNSVLSYNDYNLFFINGIQNSDIQALENAEAAATQLFNLSDDRVTPLYNHSAAFYRDAIETHALQYTDHVTSSFWRRIQNDPLFIGTLISKVCDERRFCPN